MLSSKLVAYIAAVSLCFSIPPAFAVNCASEAGCLGTCPPEVPYCYGDSIRGCYCDVLQPGCKGSLVTETTFTAMLSNSPAGPNWFTPGNSITVTQQEDAQVLVQHSEAWGGQDQEIMVPAGTLSVTALFTKYDDTLPSRLYFDVTALGAVLPSFASVALDGEQTGDNVFSLDPGESNGWIDLDTGEFFARVYARFNNGVFPGEPARVQASLFGTYDFAHNRLTVRSRQTDPDAVAVAPGD